MDLFNEESETSSHSLDDIKPLSERMRPESFDDFWGQEHLLGKNKPFRKEIENDQVKSLIFWGPPGTGKTTLGYLIARATQGQFLTYSAVISGIKELKTVISKAGNYYKMSGRKTYLFIDEIHRFNKAQQDAFLPYVEKGEIILIGATTENPSFEINSALLSRMRVLLLNRLSESDLEKIISRALTDDEKGLGLMNLNITDEAKEALILAADGDARRGLGLLENSGKYVGEKGEITVEVLKEIQERGFNLYDKSGEEHYNLISALHKTIRGGDPDASLYYLARMLRSGEDPLYVIRRLIRFAAEDIGLADPQALTLAVSARDTYHFLGSPEGELAIAQLVIYLACAPKSNSAYIAFGKALSDAEKFGSLPVPLDLRNAPTNLMKDIGYGSNYKYAHDFEDALTDQEYFPDELKGRSYYEPRNRGREVKIKEYLEWYKKNRSENKGRS